MSFDCPASRAVETLLAAREGRSVIPLLSQTIGPLSLAEGYRIQDKLTTVLSRQLGPVRGYKAAFATVDAFAKLGTSEPVSAPLFSNQLLQNGCTAHSADFRLFHIEAEIAFTVDRVIDRAFFHRDEIKPYLRSVHPGFDLADCCYDLSQASQTAADFVANGGGAAHWMIGPGVDPDSIDLDGIFITMTRDGQQVYAGAATATFGSPWNILLWLARRQLAQGQPLRPGDVILTGKVAPPWKATGLGAEGTYTGYFGPLGAVSCRVIGQSSGKDSGP